MATSGNRISRPSWPSGRKQACSACRQRKKKCDGVTPTCGPCARAGSVCVYGKLNGTGTFRPTSTSYIRTSTQDLTHFVNPHNVTSVGRPDHSVREPLSPDSCNTNHQGQSSGPVSAHLDATVPADHFVNHNGYHDNNEGTTSSFDMLSHQPFWGNSNFFLPMLDPDFGLDSSVDWLTPPSDQSTISGPFNPASHGGLSSAASVVVAPSPDQFNILLESFMFRCHSILPCLHQARLEKEISTNFEGFKASPLFWTIAAAGAWYHKDNEQLSHTDIWLQQACVLIDKNIQTVKEPLQTLQSLVYVIYQSLVSAAMVQMWMQLGNACRLVSLLGWNKLDSKHFASLYSPKTSSEEVKEEWRRVIWIVFLLDRAMSYVAAWPLGLDDRHFMVRYPRVDTDFQNSIYSSASENYSMDLDNLLFSSTVGGNLNGDRMNIIFRAYALMGRIITYHNDLHEERPTGTPTVAFTELENTLTKFHLLVHGVSNRSQPLTTEDRFRQVWISILVQICTIMLYHPMVEETPSDNIHPNKPCMRGYERCIDAMRNIVNKIKDGAMSDMDGLLNSLLLPAYFLASRFLILTWHETKNVSDRNCIEIILMLIDRIEDLWPPLAKKYRRSIMADLARNVGEVRRLRKGTGNYLSDSCRE